MAGEVRNFRDLDVWQAGMDLVLVTYDLSDSLPDRERYGLCAQMRRASVSIPSNVAEGHAFRINPKGYGRHVRIALGSLAELETHIELGLRLKFWKPANVRAIQGLTIRTGQMLHGLLRALNVGARQAERSECRTRLTPVRASRPIVARHSRRRRGVTAKTSKGR